MLNFYCLANISLNDGTKSNTYSVTKQDGLYASAFQNDVIYWLKTTFYVEKIEGGVIFV